MFYCPALLIECRRVVRETFAVAPTVRHAFELVFGEVERLEQKNDELVKENDELRARLRKVQS